LCRVLQILCLLYLTRVDTVTATTMTEISAVGKDADLEPRVNRRRPFDLHWRKAPPAWQGNVEMAYHRSNPHLTSDEFCCFQCGSRPCPFDHDEEGQEKFQGVEFVGKLVAENNSLLSQLNEVTRIGYCWSTLMTRYALVADVDPYVIHCLSRGHITYHSPSQML